VARQVGYANRGTAHRAVAQALSERLVDGAAGAGAVPTARPSTLGATPYSPSTVVESSTP
jgi:hypothetical protein